MSLPNADKNSLAVDSPRQKLEAWKGYTYLYFTHNYYIWGTLNREDTSLKFRLLKKKQSLSAKGIHS
jgi:hypothetical protein